MVQEHTSIVYVPACIYMLLAGVGKECSLDSSLVIVYNYERTRTAFKRLVVGGVERESARVHFSLLVGSAPRGK